MILRKRVLLTVAVLSCEIKVATSHGVKLPAFAK
jgi:hypothetical protein